MNDAQIRQRAVTTTVENGFLSVQNTTTAGAGQRRRNTIRRSKCGRDTNHERRTDRRRGDSVTDERNGFISVRTGLLEHVQKGWMDEQMFLAYCIMLDQCDWKTGIWIGSSYKLQAATPSWSLSTCKRVINRLARGQYIDSEHIRGSRGNYQVLVNNYEPTAGKLKGKRLRKTETCDWREAVKLD